MPYPAHVSDAAYCYDGSYAGFLCCIFESYAKKESPQWRAFFLLGGV